MSAQTSKQNPRALKQLVRLYELRQNKAQKEYQQQQSSVIDAQAALDKRNSDHEVVMAEKLQLNAAVHSDAHSSNLFTQKQIQIRRRWSKYDTEKTEYFVNEAQCDLNVEKQESDRLRKDWMQLKNKAENYADRFDAAITEQRREQEMFEESEQEDEALSRYIAGVGR